MNFSENLKRIRKEKNLSQEQLADKLDVSRQSVSKWESRQAYPEMDKLVKICEMFDISMDELINGNVKKTINNKNEKNNINKLIDDFLEYMTKVVDMFTCMDLKEKTKCVSEQFLIIIFMWIIFTLISAICFNICGNILNLLPNNIEYIISNILESIYTVLALIIGIVILLHVFKVRYLDYYKIVKKEVKEESTEIVEKEKKVIHKNVEKIIIRDPEHSGYKFISYLLQIMIFILKIIATIISLEFCMSLVALVIGFVLSFMFVKIGLIFYGTLLILISCIAINLIILIILSNFIISKKNNKIVEGIIIFISLIFIGIGIGLITYDISNFEIIENMNSNNFITEQTTIPMTDGLFIHDSYYVEYVENNSNDILIETTHSKYYDIITSHTENNGIWFHLNPKTNEMNMIKVYIEDINNKKIIDYSNYKVTIYTSKENIEKLKENKMQY